MIGQLDMFAMLDPAPSIEPMMPCRWETIAIDPYGSAMLRKVEASYSAMSLSSSGKVLRPFDYRSKQWVNTGGHFHRGNADLECYRIVPVAEFAGPGEACTYHLHGFHHERRDDLGGYHGMMAKLGVADVVLVGPPIVFVHKAGVPD